MHPKNIQYFTKITLILVLFFHFSNAFAQDTNSKFLKIRKFKISELPTKVEETSALNFFQQNLFTLNDSGNSAELHQLNPENGTLVNTLPISGIQNFDWEALSNDEKYFYIGDIGNNWGTRTDLKIYKISIDSLKHEGEIKFYYPEQKEFIKKPQANDFDAESMVFIKGNLHIFTKEWSSYNTTHYVVSTETSEESVPAKILEKFHLGYIATDAAYFDGKLYIVGYTKKMEVYLSVFQEDDLGLFFSKNSKKFFIGMSTGIGQIEGIAVNNNGVYISGERFVIKPFDVPQRLYFIPKNKFEKFAK